MPLGGVMRGGLRSYAACFRLGAARYHGVE